MPRDPLARTADEGLPRLALDARQAARCLSIGTTALWQLTVAGKIPCVRVGRKVLYPVDALREWLRARTEGGDA